jgi:hypothetical protein
VPAGFSFEADAAARRRLVEAPAMDELRERAAGVELCLLSLAVQEPKARDPGRATNEVRVQRFQRVL